tara:strand:- start:1485 stop:2198 length:714 start_codon:yes stop_codon:yes gene_type:complete
MCDMGLTAMAMSAASQAANVGAQRQQAKAQEASQLQASVGEMERFQLAQRAQRARQSDEETTAALERQKARREETEAVATTITSAEESGVSGTSVGLAVAEYARKNAEYQAALTLQENMNATARRLGFESGGNAYVNRMAQINQPIAQPNYLGAALGMGQTIAGGITGFKKQQTIDTMMGKQETLIDLQTSTAREGLKIASQNAANAATSAAAARGATQIMDAQRRTQTYNILGGTQ